MNMCVCVSEWDCGGKAPLWVLIKAEKRKVLSQYLINHKAFCTYCIYIHLQNCDGLFIMKIIFISIIPITIIITIYIIRIIIHIIYYTKMKEIGVKEHNCLKIVKYKDWTENKQKG